MDEQVITDRTVALAGLAQTAELVQGLARTGKIDQHYLDVCIKSLFAFDANTVVEIYGDSHAIRMGLMSLRESFFKPKSPMQAELMRYGIQLIQLAKKVQNSPAISQQLADQLKDIDTHHEIESISFDNEIIEEIASVYLDCISPIKPRVIISGEQGYLAQEETAAKVRVCLLAGVRSAFLWLQKGGSKLQLMTARKQYQDRAAQLLSQML